MPQRRDQSYSLWFSGNALRSDIPSSFIADAMRQPGRSDSTSDGQTDGQTHTQNSVYQSYVIIIM